MKNKLTTKEYWENYYKSNYANKSHIIKVSSYYDMFWKQFISENPSGHTIIEIGGFPGRFLAYLSSKYNLVPTCLDYNSDLNQIKDVFKVMNVNEYKIIQDDFTTYAPRTKYDYVMSNGFIEHFENFDEILDKHLPYVKPGGRLFVMIPNKRYLRQVYGYLCDYENLKAHNLKSMKLEVFKNFANRKNLEIKNLQYYGGFPFSVHQKLNSFQSLIFKVVRLIFKKGINPILMKHPSKYLSSSIIAIFEKPLDH